MIKKNQCYFSKNEYFKYLFERQSLEELKQFYMRRSMDFPDFIAKRYKEVCFIINIVEATHIFEK